MAEAHFFQLLPGGRGIDVRSQFSDDAGRVGSDRFILEPGGNLLGISYDDLAIYEWGSIEVSPEGKPILHVGEAE